MATTHFPLCLHFQYNIPIDIFLPILYPTDSPRIFVRPTASKYGSEERIIGDIIIYEYLSIDYRRELLVILLSIIIDSD